MTFNRRRPFYLISALLVAGAFSLPAAVPEQDIYGPVNLLKTLPTPFSPPAARPAAHDAEDLNSFNKSVIAIAPRSARGRRSLCDRLVSSSRFYLPGRLVIGRTAEFTVKGPPGFYAALAMADKDAGARPIYGHPIRLGADRKVVCLGRIPADGLLHLVIETPIEGDLIGQRLFFEAAVWSRLDFSDVEIAEAVSSEGQPGVKNGVLVAEQPDEKKGIKIIPEANMPSLQIANPQSSLESGRP